RRNGEATPIGWIAEQSSCVSPGTVSSLLRAPPPMRSAASSTVTVTPARARVTAPARPLGPEPTTTAPVMVYRASWCIERHGVSRFILACGLQRHRNRTVGAEPRLALHHRGHVDVSRLHRSGCRVDDPVALALVVDRL